MLPRLKMDGIYGAFTGARGIAFQRKAMRLKVDGVCGDATERRLSEKLAWNRVTVRTGEIRIVGSA